MNQSNLPTSPPDPPQFSPTHDPASHTFLVVRGERKIAELTYLLRGNVAVIDHTWVDPGERGTGIAMSLVEACVAWARENRIKLEPMCSYAVMAFARRPDFADVHAD